MNETSNERFTWIPVLFATTHLFTQSPRTVLCGHDICSIMHRSWRLRAISPHTTKIIHMVSHAGEHGVPGQYSASRRSTCAVMHRNRLSAVCSLHCSNACSVEHSRLSKNQCSGAALGKANCYVRSLNHAF